MLSETMLSFYKRNLSKLSDKHADLFKDLREAIEYFEKFPEGSEDERFLWEKSATPNANFTYERKDPAFSSPYCGIHPEKETEELLRSINLEHPSVVSIFGIGLGYGLKAFLKNRPHTNFSIIVVEKNPQIFLRALCARDWTSEFEDTTIKWIVGSNRSQISTKLAPIFAENSTVDRYLKIIPTPAAISSESDFYGHIAAMMMSTRDLSVLLFGNSIPDQLLGLTNAVENTPHCITNPGIRPLANAFAGKICISVAAGPSANEHFEQLKKLQGKIPIFACESIMKPLYDRGIYPDFITAIERDDYVPKFFRNIQIHERSSLVAPNVLMKECYELYKGDQILYSIAQGFLRTVGLEYLGAFYPGSSAGNLNLAFASYLGFQTIIMVGHNLAFGYQTNETHVRGTIDPDRERARTEEELIQESSGRKWVTQDGTTEVYTKIEWDIFRAQIENLISEHSQRNWINTAPKGARIAGAQLMSFEEALAKFGQEPFDIFNEKKKLRPAISQVEIDERISNIKLHAGKSLESIYKFGKRGKEIQKKLLQWEKKIAEKELGGGRVSIAFLDTAIDEVLGVKVAAVNEDPYFYSAAIQVMIPAHIVFERNLNEMRAHYKDDYNLKKDFLLRHKQYFSIWEEVLPQISAQIEKLLSFYRESHVSAWGD